MSTAVVRVLPRGVGKPTQRSRNFAAQRQRSNAMQATQPMIGSIPVALGYSLPVQFPGSEWHKISGYSFGSTSTNYVYYQTFEAELKKFPDLIHANTVVYSVLIGFTVKADGYPGFDEAFDSTALKEPEAPNRHRFLSSKYCGLEKVFPAGTVASDLNGSHAILWVIDAAFPSTMNANSGIKVHSIWWQTAKLPPMKPPQNFLQCEK
ncbi:coat protein [Lilac ring mottle virus]|uniref:Coat protein n=1 Tax=Lilac ring mottle virus TaxID=37125 RepID=Q83069_9BROM|nr:coat protein [Lilac ring mottle virus]AAA64840.1 coat protein [Lilac ring mottle virus]prf//2116346B coat protein [Lilac ring mottle virus]